MKLSPKHDAENASTLLKAFLSALILTAFFYSSSAYADISFSNVNLDVLVENFAASVPQLMQLVTAISYVLGMFFIIAAVMGMKHFGESRTMMSQEHAISGPLIEFFVGVALLYLPSSVWTALDTFWQTPVPYQYLSATSDQFTTFTTACYQVIQLIGTIAFIRGLIILSHAGGKGAQQGQLGKALSHIVGGVLCINIYQTIQLVQSTFGSSSS